MSRSREDAGFDLLEAALTGRVEVTVDYGYDIHSIVIGISERRRILAGEPLRLTGRGFRSRTSGWRRATPG